jgi:hypothetical protein
MTLTHTGEQGYVFYIPNEYAVHVFESLVEAGQPFGLKQCGYYAMRALRFGSSRRKLFTLLTANVFQNRKILRILGPRPGFSIDTFRVRSGLEDENERRH